MLTLEGFEVERKHVRALKRKLHIHAICRKPITSAAHPEHKV